MIKHCIMSDYHTESDLYNGSLESDHEPREKEFISKDGKERLKCKVKPHCHKSYYPSYRGVASVENKPSCVVFKLVSLVESKIVVEAKRGSLILEDNMDMKYIEKEKLKIVSITISDTLKASVLQRYSDKPDRDMQFVWIEFMKQDDTRVTHTWIALQEDTTPHGVYVNVKEESASDRKVECPHCMKHKKHPIYGWPRGGEKCDHRGGNEVEKLETSSCIVS